MPTGRVKWFDNRKGFGFVEQETGEDVFVHYTAIEGEGFRTLNDGEMVQFEVVQGPKGLLARRVTRIEAIERESEAAS
ncbi:MAG: cold-shock protein [Planctomycetes bacterium]|nr:cold-shock protein [Planctomycetota bacterium]